jgi:hypothetical protein
MPGFVVTMGNGVTCAHGGNGSPMLTNPSVKIIGQTIVLQTTLYAIAGCPFMLGPVPSPCLTGIWSTGATRVRSRGLPLLITGSQGQTVPNGTPMTIVPQQIRVKAT